MKNLMMGQLRVVGMTRWIHRTEQTESVANVLISAERPKYTVDFSEEEDDADDDANDNNDLDREQRFSLYTAGVLLQ